MSLLAALGNLSLDVVAGAPPRPGGPVFYAARTFSYLSADARVAASCAKADRTTLMPALEGLGLPVAWFESSGTATYRFHYKGEARSMWQDAIGDPWEREQAVAAAGDAEWIHVGALARTDFPPETLAALADGRRLLLDGQGLVRTPALGRLQTDGEIGDALRNVAILKVNDEEAATLTGTPEPKRLRALEVPEVILTLGSRGSYVVTDTAIEHVAVPIVVGETDPTGAGDTYAASYLEARSRGADPVEAARAATQTVAELVL